MYTVGAGVIIYITASWSHELLMVVLCATADGVISHYWFTIVFYYNVHDYQCLSNLHLFHLR